MLDGLGWTTLGDTKIVQSSNRSFSWKVNDEIFIVS